MKSLGYICVGLGILVISVVISSAKAPAAEAVRPDAEGIRGTLIIVGGGTIPRVAKERLAARVGPGKLLIIGQASNSPELACLEAAKWIRDAGVSNVVVPEFTGEPNVDAAHTIEELTNAKGVWICGGQQARLSEAFLISRVEKELKDLLNRGGVIGGTSAGAAIMSQVMIASGKDRPTISLGWDLLPWSIIDQHFTQRDRAQRLRIAVHDNRNRFGLGIDEDTAAIITGRTLQVGGEGTVSVLLSASEHLTASEKVLRAGDLADCVQLCRAARDRSLDFEYELPRKSAEQISEGKLVIVGGGRMPQDIVRQFVELAGGKAARIVVLPTAGSRSSAFRASIPEFLASANVADVRVLPHSRPDEVNSDEFQRAIRQATAIWFGGGRQWNFVDAYEDTIAIELFRDVLRRGGVIGGSSAGATIQGDFLVRGHPLGNSTMVAEGYQRGFAFLPRVAIDQHFTQRHRQADLRSVVLRYPKYLGIGIDEATALIVQGNRAQVAGSHAVHFLTADRLDQPNEFLSARAGDQISLQPLAVIGHSAEK